MSEFVVPQWEDASAYHADRTAISNSAKEVYRRSPQRYWRIYVAETMQPLAPTEAQQIGTLVHMAVFEPDRFASNIVVAPRVDRRTREGKETWAAFSLEHGHKEIVSVEVYDTVREMAKAVKSHPVASHIIERPGNVEHAIRWLCGNTGLALKARRDFVSAGLIVDLKTTQDATPEGFAKTCFSWGYHRQAAWYLDGQFEVTKSPSDFVFIAVENKPPHSVACYELDEQSVELGFQQNESILKRMKASIESCVWTAAHERQITKLSLPRWARYHDEWEVAE